jgi:hypothetical protein
MLTFSYPNSDTNREPAVESTAPEAAQSQAAAPEAPIAQPERVFSYPNTNPALPEGTPAEKLPEAVRELREADDARKFFSPQRDYRDSGLEDAFVDGSDESKAAIAEAREMFADHGLNTHEARDVVQITKQLCESAPTPEQEQAWQTEAWNDLVRSHGQKGAAEALDLARKLVARDPRVAEVLQITRAGSHPRIVKLLVEKARAEAALGRL